MTGILEVGAPPIAVVVRRRRNARRMTLRVGRDGVTLTLPQTVAERVARQFLEDRETWLRAQLARHPAPVLVRPGVSVPVEGAMVPVIADKVGPFGLVDDAIRVRARGDNASTGAAVAAILKAESRNRLAEAVRDYADQLGRRPGRLTMRDTKSRWGSCSSDGNLMFSWRLIMAPSDILDYVAAHEVAHLIEMNHSARFWAVVRELKPGFAVPRAWLRENGAELHAYRFSA